MSSSSNLLTEIQRHPSLAGLQLAPKRGAGSLGHDSVDTGLDDADDGVVGAGALADAQIGGGDANLVGNAAHGDGGLCRGGAGSQFGIHLCSDVGQALVDVVAGARLGGEPAMDGCMEKLITRKEAAKILGISIATLDAARNNGQISYVQYVENGCVYFTDRGLQKYIAKYTHKAKPIAKSSTYRTPRKSNSGKSHI